LHFRRSGGEVAQILAVERQDLRGLPLSLRKTNLARLLARRPDGIFVAPFEQGEIGPDLLRAEARIRLMSGCRISSNACAHKRLVSALGATSR
jgi:flagellar basal body rod protein FlgF